MDHATTDIENAPLPTPRTLRLRQSLPYQIWRFITLNIRFAKIIAKGGD